MRRLHVNKARLILLLALLFTALGAGVFRTPPILFMASTLCGAPLIGICVGRLASRGLRISRQMPTCGMVGDVIRVRFTVSNVGWCPAFLVHSRSLCFEASPEMRRTAEKTKPVRRRDFRRLLRHCDAELEQARLEAAFLPLDEFNFEVSSPREKYSGASAPTEDEAEQVKPIVLPGGNFGGEARWKLAKRGEYCVPGAGAGAFDPIGLFTEFSARSASQVFVVMPRPLKLHRLDLLAGATGTQQPRGSASVADAAEMNGVRPHRPGEGMRRIHWKATARSNVLHVVEWEEETANGVTILIDVYAPHIAGSTETDTLESSVLAAASVASYCLENGQRVALFWWEKNALGAPQLAHVEGRHRGTLSTVLTTLARIAACEHADATLPNLMREVAGQGAWAEGLLVVGSDQCDWAKTWQMDSSGKARRGLAFDSATFAAETTGAAHGRPFFQDLPSGVRRVRRNDLLSFILEQGI